MEIIIEIHQGEDGRPEGSVRAANSSEARPFSGNLEFLALVEHLYQSEEPSKTSPTDAAKGTDNV
jgi:hypothetical protein